MTTDPHACRDCHQPYTVCPHCSCQYCRHYWLTCPRCVEMRHRSAAHVTDEEHDRRAALAAESNR
jgi:hypothetical protein